MADRDEIERRIVEAMATETTAVGLSEKLFSPEGLFNQLAATAEERRQVASSPLFRQAQARFHALQEEEAQAFARAVEQAQASLPRGKHLIKEGRAPAG